jgi:hypothetical protein
MEDCAGGGVQYEYLGGTLWELQESALHQLAEVAEKKKLQVKPGVYIYYKHLPPPPPTPGGS